MRNVYRDGDRSSSLTLKPYLRDGEQILWTGTPYEKRGFRPPLPAVLFIAIWICFAIGWTVSASAMGGLFGLAGIPFILFGFGMLWLLTFGIVRRAKYTLYALTDTRALILTETRQGITCIDYPFAGLSGVILRSVRDGSGTVELIGPEAMYLHAMNYGFRQHRGHPAGASFEMIADVERVYRMISDRIPQEGKKAEIQM